MAPAAGVRDRGRRLLFRADPSARGRPRGDGASSRLPCAGHLPVDDPRTLLLRSSRDLPRRGDDRLGRRTRPTGRGPAVGGAGPGADDCVAVLRRHPDRRIRILQPGHGHFESRARARPRRRQGLATSSDPGSRSPRPGRREQGDENRPADVLAASHAVIGAESPAFRRAGRRGHCGLRAGIGSLAGRRMRSLVQCGRDLGGDRQRAQPAARSPGQ